MDIRGFKQVYLNWIWQF